MKKHLGKQHAPGGAAHKKRTAAVVTVMTLCLAVSVAGGLVGYHCYQEAKNRITVSFDTDGGSEIPAMAVKKGTTLESIPCADRENSDFTGWYYDEALTQPYFSDDAFDANTMLYAAYEEDSDEVYESESAYVPDCDASASIILQSDDEITAENLGEYLTVDSYLGTMPSGFTVTSLGDGKYEITPEQAYQAGCTYDFSTSNGASIVTEEEGEVTSLSQRIHKEDAETVVLKNEILYLDWDSVIRDGSDYALYIPQSDTYTLTEGMPICLLDGYTEWAAAGEDQDTFGQLFNDATLFLKTTAVDCTFSAKTVAGQPVSGDTWYYVTAEDGELADVIDDVDIYAEYSVPAKEMIDTAELEKSISESAGVNQIADLLTCAVADDATFLQMADGDVQVDDLLLNSLSASAADGNSLLFRSGLSMGNEKGVKIPVRGDNITVSVSWSGDSASNPNFPGVDASDPNNNQWSAMRVKINFEREIKGVAVKAAVDVTEYLKVTMQGYKEWDGSKISFDYAANMYSQSNFDFSVQVRTDGGDWTDISDSINSSLSSADMVQKYQQMIGADGGYIDLCDVELVGKDFYVIPEFPIFTVHLGLNYVLKFDLSAGITSNFSYLDATQIGMRGKTGEGIQSYKNELVGANRYAYNLDACGYLGIKTGLKGELTLSFTGLRKLGEVGITLELGTYVDVYGYLSLEITKPQQYSGKVNKSLTGGYYMEMGIYLEIRLIARSQTFDVEAGVTLLDEKWKLLSLGNRYVACGINGTGNAEYFMHTNSADITDVCGLSTTCLDLKTGELVENIPLSSLGKFYPHISDSSFQFSNMQLSIDASKSKQKTRVATIDLYCSVPMLTAAKSNDEGYVCITTKLYWADPNLAVNSIADFSKTFRAVYYLKFPDGTLREMDSKEVRMGESVGYFSFSMYHGGYDHIYQMEDALYTDTESNVASFADMDRALKDVYLTEDTAYYRNAEKKQFYVSFVYYDSLAGCWKGDMRVCAAGDIPVVPETALNTPALKQWDGHDNAAGTDVSAISALSDNPKNYYYQWSTVGEDPSRSLKVYQGTEQQVQNQIEEYFNDLKAEETGKKTHYNPESTFTQTYAASYNDCNVTFIYGKDGEEYSASSTMKFDSPITTPDNAYFIESVGYLEGWDVDGDGISDIGKDKNNNFVFPNATTDGLVYRGIYEQPDIRVHVQAYDTAQRDYVEVASFSAKSLQQFTFDGKNVLLDGEKVILDGDTVDCFQKALDQTSADAEFLGWERSAYSYYGFQSVNETESLSYLQRQCYFRPKCQVYRNLTYLPAEGTKLKRTVDGVTQELDSYCAKITQGMYYTMYYWWGDFDYSVFQSESADEVTSFVGWDSNNDGVVDYGPRDGVVVRGDMTLRAVCETKKLLVNVEDIASPIPLDFPDEVLPFITDNTTGDGSDGYHYSFEGVYSDYLKLDAYIEDLYKTTRYVDPETGYTVFYYRWMASTTTHTYYPNGKAETVWYQRTMTIREVHNGHTVTFNAGEGGYFQNNDGTRKTEFTRELDNGTYSLSEITKYYNTKPWRDAEGDVKYFVDYWTDENGDKIENDEFVVSKQGKTLTAHWSYKAHAKLKTGNWIYGDYTSEVPGSMWMPAGTYKYGDLIPPPVSNHFSKRYRYEVTGWKDSRDTEDIIHSLDEEFTFSPKDDVTFTAQWELTGLELSFDTYEDFKSGTGNLPLEENFNFTHSVILPLGEHSVSDFPILKDKESGSFTWRCAGWKDASGNIYYLNDENAKISLTTEPIALTPVSEVAAADVRFYGNDGIFEDGSRNVTRRLQVGDHNVATDFPVPTHENTMYEEYTLAGWRVNATRDEPEQFLALDDVFHMKDTTRSIAAMWEIRELEHCYSYIYDEESHWQVCQNESCRDMPEGEKQAHTLDADGICTVCGYGCVTPPCVDGVYEISNVAHLYGFAKLVDSGETGANAVLTCDITVNENVLDSNGAFMGRDLIEWTPIGKDNPYTGIFDGQGHSISGLYYNNQAYNEGPGYAGLFAGIYGAEVKNLTIADSYFAATFYGSSIGSIAGRAKNSVISGVENQATLQGRIAGGICAVSIQCTIENCMNRGKITGNDGAAGIVVYAYEDDEENDGIALSRENLIRNCCSVGTLKVIESSDISAICSDSIQVENCYYDSDILGDVIDSQQVAGKTREEMRSGEVAYLLSQGENGNIWGQTIGEDDYPKLGGAAVYQNGEVYANGVARLQGSSISLDGTIGVHLYLSLSPEVADDAGAYLELRLPGREKCVLPVSEGEIRSQDGSEYHVFSCSVAAKDVSQPIQASIFRSDGTLMGAFTYSVEEYVAYMTEHPDAYSAESVALAQAMLQYGEYAKAYFDGDALAETAEMQNITADTLSGYVMTKSGTLPDGITYYGSSLLLESETTVRHYFKVAEGTDLTGYDLIEKDGYYYTEDRNIPAGSLGVTRTGTVGGCGIAYSPMCYARAVLGSDSANQNLKTLMKALYLYDAAAQAYLGK